MRKANLKNSTTDASRAKALFSAYQAAVVAEGEADAAVRTVRPVEPARIPVPEIGPGCRVGTVDDLNTQSELHMRNADLSGLAAHDFRTRMTIYREILTLMARANDRWRATNKVDELEARSHKAWKEREKAFKALASFLTTHPDQIRETARYVAANPTGHESWMLLSILGGKVGKGVGA